MSQLIGRRELCNSPLSLFNGLTRNTKNVKVKVYKNVHFNSFAKGKNFSTTKTPPKRGFVSNFISKTLYTLVSFTATSGIGYGLYKYYLDNDPKLMSIKRTFLSGNNKEDYWIILKKGLLDTREMLECDINKLKGTVNSIYSSTYKKPEKPLIAQKAVLSPEISKNPHSKQEPSVEEDCVVSIDRQIPSHENEHKFTTPDKQFPIKGAESTEQEGNQAQTSGDERATLTNDVNEERKLLIAREFWEKNSGYEMIQKVQDLSNEVEYLLTNVKPYLSGNTKDIVLYRRASNLLKEMKDFIGSICPADDNDPRYAKIFQLFKEELERNQKKHQKISDDERHMYSVKLKIQHEKIQTKYMNEVNKLLNDIHEEIISNIDKLEYQLQSIKNSALEYSLKFENAKKATALRSAIISIRRKIFSNSLYDLKHEHKILKEHASLWPVVVTVIESIPKDTWLTGVSTKKMIEAELASISDEIVAAGYLSPDSGLISHVAARIFSKISFARSLYSLDCDGSSVVARANYYLKIDDMSSLVKELNSLSGWKRIVSKKFMVDIRKRLELLQALNGKVHGSLARAGKVRGQTPKKEKAPKRKHLLAGRPKLRKSYNKKYFNSISGPGKRQTNTKR